MGPCSLGEDITCFSYVIVIIVGFLNVTDFVAGEIQETADDIYGSLEDATSPNEAMYNALSDGEIQVLMSNCRVLVLCGRHIASVLSVCLSVCLVMVIDSEKAKLVTVMATVD